MIYKNKNSNRNNQILEIFCEIHTVHKDNFDPIFGYEIKVFLGKGPKGPLIFASGLLENSYEGPRDSLNTEPRENPAI